MKEVDHSRVEFFEPNKFPARVSLSATSNMLYFYKEAVLLMDLKPGDRVNLLSFSGLVFIYKTPMGFKVFKNTNSDGRLKTQMRSIMPQVCARLQIKTSKTFELKATNNSYQGNQLFQLK